jgi:IclR family transcriptional regulator, pca regulon regulatory protein
VIDGERPPGPRGGARTVRERTARERPPEEAAVDTSFARGLRLLLLIADRGEARADELGAALSMPASSVYRYLRTLSTFGFVDRRGDRYHLGPRLHVGSGPVVTSERLVRHAAGVLAEVVAWSGETAVLVRRVGLTAVVLGEVASRDPLRVSLGTGASLPLARGAIGEALLAWAPRAIVDEVAADSAESGQPVDHAALDAALQRVRRSGCATDSGVIATGAVAVAAPILMPDGVVGAIGIVAPASRCNRACVTQARRRLGGAAEALAQALAAEAGTNG